MPVSKLSPPPVSLLAFADQFQAPQWLQGDCSGSIQIGIEKSPRASFQLSVQLSLGVCFSLDLGIPQVPASTLTSAIHGCQPWLPLWPSPGACFGFHLGVARVPASRLSRQPVSYLDFVGHLPAPQWWQGEGNGGVEIRVERNPKAIFHLLKGRNLPGPLSLPGPGFTRPWIYPALDLPGPGFRGAVPGRRGGVAVAA